jgi:signal peptidase I
VEELDMFEQLNIDELKKFIKDIFVIVMSVFLISSFVAQPTTVEGNSMLPTLYDADQLIIEKLSLRFTPFERYDIIVFPYNNDRSKYYIKRIIGLPGEVINIKNGKIFVNDLELNEPIQLDIIKDLGTQDYPITIPEKTFFVMGDNRNHSRDSRYVDVGLIKEEDVIGKGFFRIYPFSNVGFLEIED